MMRFASLLTTSCLLTSPAIAQAECWWRLGWPNDERIWAVPWGAVPRGGFLTRIDCERVIDTMLREAIRGQALLIELPTCVCVPGYDDFAHEGIRNARKDLLQRAQIGGFGHVVVKPRSKRTLPS